MRPYLLSLLPLSLIGCDGTTEKPDSATLITANDDGDGDGFTIEQGDCDDGDAAISPTGTEICDGRDNDCDGQTDEEVAQTFYIDGDGDGYGDVPTAACTMPQNASETGGDCDDGDAEIYPGAAEACDEIDNDCDGEIDDGVTQTSYADADGDGYGDRLTPAEGCVAPDGYVADSDDCDDGRDDVNPEAAEVCDGQDNDCDGTTDEDVALPFYADLDGDGYGDPALPTESCAQPAGYAANDLDCDDGDAAISPAGVEACNGADDDCDGLIDEGSPADAPIWYADDDGDGYGDDGNSYAACAQPRGYIADDTDCDDVAAAIYPGAPEVCNGVDDDCDGDTDEADATDAATWYLDADSDGYGNPYVSQAACAAPGGYVASGTDCDDGAANAHPGALEVCDYLDNDCDGATDEADAADASTWYLDADSDGFGDPALPSPACAQPAGYASNALDCDDGDLQTYPGAPEFCDGIDNDCDGSVDEDSAVDASTFYADGDGDGYGDPGASTSGCAAPSGYVTASSDCDDADATAHPGALEYCDGADDDCDGTADDGAVDASAWYLDADSDGYGNPSISAAACTAPSGYVAAPSDCADLDDQIHPGAAEVCNSLDDDCDGVADDGVGATWYADADRDGFGDPGATAQACTQPAGYVSNASDCDDASAAHAPGEIELVDGADSDCDGQVDEAIAALIFAYQCNNSSGSSTPPAALTDREASAITGYLGAMGVGVDRYDEGSAGVSGLNTNNYEVLLYTTCGWGYQGANATTRTALLNARSAGIATFLFSDDLTWDDSGGAGRGGGDPQLALMTNAGGNGSAGSLSMRATAHPAYIGPYGTPANFSCSQDMDATAAWSNGEVVLADHSSLGGPAWVVYEDGFGVRAASLACSIYTANHGDIGSAGDQAQAAVLFKNTVAWLLGL